MNTRFFSVYRPFIFWRPGFYHLGQIGWCLFLVYPRIYKGGTERSILYVGSNSENSEVDSRCFSRFFSTYQLAKEILFLLIVGVNNNIIIIIVINKTYKKLFLIDAENCSWGQNLNEKHKEARRKI